MHKGQRIKKGDVARIEILTAIYVYALEHQRPISYKELAAATDNASTSTVFRHTGILQKMGYLRKYNQGEPRSLIVTPEGIKAVQSGTL
ncbi:MAG: hypothetical protein ABS917_11135 [Solibacillus sp.]|uniref:hypothetical protein n=1 Tax=Solibacillus sp. TaxID=1909654 RepID=UPI0033164A92